MLDHPDEKLDQAKLMDEAGLDSSEWVLTGYRQWGPQDAKQSYLAVVPRKPESPIVPAREAGIFQRKAVVAPKRGARQVVILSDQHAPYVDWDLHQAVLNLLNDLNPCQVVLPGDLMEFSSVSRHRTPPQFQEVQRGLDSGYSVLRDYVASAPNAQFDLLYGNHDVRLSHYLSDRAPELYGIRRAELDDSGELVSALSLRHLLRLDELGINSLDPGVNYESGQVAIGEHLAVRHGSRALKHSGATALAHLNDLGTNIIVGHSHRLGQVFRTIYDVQGNPTVQTGIEAGYLGTLELSETYTSGRPNWQQGLVVLDVHADDTFAATLVPWVKGSLYFQGSRY